MAKAMYSLKIWLFRDQFTMTKRECNGIQNICIFVVKIYIHAWFTAATAYSAPRHDLQLLKDFFVFENHHPSIPFATVALKKFLGHLWYLSEELVALSFFDDQVTLETKRRMLWALHHVPGADHHMSRAAVDVSNIAEKSLEDFVTTNTRNVFHITGFLMNFLETDPETWEDDPDFRAAKQTVKSLKVVNDTAERGLAQIEEYNKLHTTDEEQKQFLLLLVKHVRKEYPDRKKKTLSK